MKVFFLLFAFGMMIIITCERQSTNITPNDAEVVADIVQLGGCANEALQKGAENDSCFTYTFDKDLIVDFCVTANCCPDTNRFEMDYSIDAGIIHVTVKDTAAHLCRCICPYLIHAEFSDLYAKQYEFKVEYDDEIIYDEIVKR